MADTKTNEPRLVPLRKGSRDAIDKYLSWREEQGEEITSDRPLILSHQATARYWHFQKRAGLSST